MPLGRWPATEAEVAAWEVPDLGRRTKLLGDWMELTGVLRLATGAVAASWLSGSYFSGKETPGDIDVVYWVHHERLDSMQPSGFEFLTQLAAGAAKTHMGLELDVAVCPWWPRPGVYRGNNPVRKEEYLESRGYWDDLWSRRKDGPLAESKLLRRGYLEVIHDGYTGPTS